MKTIAEEYPHDKELLLKNISTYADIKSHLPFTGKDLAYLYPEARYTL